MQNYFLYINHLFFLQMNNSSNLNFKKTQLKKAQLKKAFSLIELSVVVLIIGILIAGITQSSRLVIAMKLNTARSLTRSSDVNSIRNLTAWFDATAEGVFSTTIPATVGATYTDPSHRDSVLVWKDSSPQDTDADKVILYNATSANAPIYLNSAISGLPALYFDGGDILQSINQVTLPLPAGSLNYSMFVVFNYDKTATCRIAGLFSIGNNSETSVKVDTWDSNYITIDFSKTTNFANSWFQFNKTISTATNYAFGFSADLNDTYANLACPSGSGCNKVKAYLNSSSPIDRRNTGNSGSPAGINFGTTGYFGIGGDVNSGTTLTNLYGVSTPLPSAQPAEYGCGVGSSGFKGLISELLIFDRTLTNEESASIMSYLIKKYNIKAL